ncbi:hypothetical protein GGF46_000164 [Coemansia sp. RSA 552]|nr:hypothetical protein GGF46_000164 [Coemansia sp. RSA 552]
MDATELAVYQQKLGEVELALSADPENTELQQLRSEIEDLLSLGAQLQTASARTDKPKARAASRAAGATTQVQKQQHVWRIGDSCEARYTDGKFYPARVVAARADNVYQVTFVGYGDMQDTRADDLRRPPAEAAAAAASATTTGGQGEGAKDTPARGGGAEAVAGGRAGKQRAKRRADNTRASSSQQAWLKFAKGGGSKKLKAKAINDQSIFKSPDTVAGRVGVANSGKGMTKNPRPTKL